MVANGAFTHPLLPRINYGAGIQLPGATILPPAGEVVAYVRSGGPVDGDDESIRSRMVNTLAAALPYCRSGRDDIIIVLPGHAENVTDNTMLANLVAGTKIVGLGWGSNRPTFTWTATAGQWTLDQANVVVSNCKFDMTGVDAVVDGIEVSAAYCAIDNCEFDVADSDAAAALIAISVGAAGTHFQFTRNFMHGEATAGITDGLLIDGATNNTYIAGNRMMASASASNGLIRVSAAATELVIVGNIIANTETASTACIAFGNAANTGICAYNVLSTLNDGTASAQGVTFGAASLVRAFENYSSDEPKLSGILAPAAAT